MRWLLALGAMGGALWFVGDLLYYGAPGPGDVTGQMLTAAIQGKPVGGLHVSGMLGPAGTLLCLAGVLGFWRAAQPGHARLVTCLLLASVFVLWGSTHQLFAARALALHEAPTSAATRAVVAYWAEVQMLLQGAAYPAALASIALVAFGRTAFPRWLALTNFGLLSLLEPALRALPAPAGAPIVSGFSNLAVAIWFAACAVFCRAPV